MTSTIQCDNCKSKEYSIFLSDVTSWEYAGRFRLVRCKNCSLVYLSPRPSKLSIGKYYPGESYWGKDLTIHVAHKNWKGARDKNYNVLYKAILEKRRRGSIIDIGAGTGLFLTKFKELNWEVDGVELSESAVAYGKKMNGIQLKTGDFLDFTFPKERFDVVTLNNALEHLYNPRETLEGVYSILKNDGILVITVPNIESLGFGLFGKQWYPLQVPRHLYHFSPGTLTNMLNRCGFQVTRIDHSYWVHNYYSLFESFRFLLSPRFAKKRMGGLVSQSYKKQYSMKVELGKVAGRLFAFMLAHIGAILRRGDVVTAYAQKRA